MNKRITDDVVEVVALYCPICGEMLNRKMLEVVSDEYPAVDMVCGECDNFVQLSIEDIDGNKCIRVSSLHSVREYNSHQDKIFGKSPKRRMLSKIKEKMQQSG